MSEQKKIPRKPITGGLVISKADAAERQLCTAIWLWFHGFDPVPVHALACAALKILWKLHEKHGTGYQTMRDIVIEKVQPEYQKDFIVLVNETENFIKHADRDPMEFHTFKPDATDFVIMDAVAALQAFNARMPVEAQAFQSWFFIQHPDLLKAGDHPYLKVVSEARQYSANMPKPEFYKYFVEASLLGRQKAASEHYTMTSKAPEAQ